MIIILIVIIRYDGLPRLVVEFTSNISCVVVGVEDWSIHWIDSGEAIG